MICARCDKPIKPGQGKTYPIDSASAAAADVTVHKGPCERVDQPTVQSGLGILPKLRS